MFRWRALVIVLGLSLFALLCVYGIVPNVFAQTTVATVNIESAKIVSSQGDKVTVSFDITNRTGVQSGVKYGILLSSIGTGSNSSLVDEEVYGTPVNLTQNDVVPEQVVYNAPSYLTGTYEVVVEAENQEGLPLGMEPAGKVTLKGASQYLEIVPNSCYLTVAQDATSTHYTLSQGVDVLPAEDFIAHCSVTNTFGQLVAAIPMFTTYDRSVFGSLNGSTTLSAVTIPAGKAIPETFEIPKATDPQAYDTILTLGNASGSITSNGIVIHYVLHGESATIQNLVFDKSSYASGNMANLSFFWSGSADSFPGSRLGMTNFATTTVSIQIDNNAEAPCASAYSDALGADQVTVSVAIPITAPCVGPQALVTLANASGTILAQTTFATTPTTTPVVAVTSTESSTPSGSSGPWNTLTILLVVVIIIAIVLAALWFMMRRKKPPVDMHTVILLLITMIGIGAFGIRFAKADTVISTVYLGPNHYYNVVYNFNLDNSSYAPGAPIMVTAAAATAQCMNGDALGVTETMTATINGDTQTLYNNYVDEYSSAINQSTFTAQTTPGSYDADFVASSSYSGGDTPAPVTDEIPYDVIEGTASSSSPTSTATPQAQSQPEPVGPPTCSFYSDPSTIVLPEASNLDYSCKDVTYCTIQGNNSTYYPTINSDFTTQGSQAVAVTTSTIYTLDCRGGGASADFVVDLQTGVNVVSPNVFEIAP